MESPSTTPTHLYEVSRSTFNKNGKCRHTHTILFSSPDRAEKYVTRAREIDSLYKFPADKWDYQVQPRAIY